ncbi:methyl-accepting chemotaxis protein [Pilimelia columellifera]|uniref:Methyl-accepting transducer domain-containing protein n=1 Tax=Pilimelia columellifera subsp. columellifera TaxID=706583 RepID=A0ABP6AXC9_9ACTN
MTRRHWTFGQRLAAGFGAMVVLTLIMAAVAIIAVNSVRSGKDQVINNGMQVRLQSEQLLASAGEQAADTRGYLLTGNEQVLAKAERATAAFEELVQQLRANPNAGPESQVLLGDVEEAHASYRVALGRVVAQRRAGAPLATVGANFERTVLPQRVNLDQQVNALNESLTTQLMRERDVATAQANRAVAVVLGVAMVVTVLGVLMAWLLARMLGHQIGGVVGHIQSSSAELEAVAAQQANGARDQATAMNEITTTTNELSITSRQIVDTAQRVSRTAEQTAEAARTGDATIEQTRVSIAAIRRQVDLIVQHMLSLGEKSQQIGGIVELVAELAEQTNILAINATIEASGAGEWGRRFGVVADEIRKLADRTSSSAKEIQALVDDVRGAVNTTVMATETGAKAVDSGAQRFDEVTEAFERISHQVATTTDAAREIELSTRQQSTAVEQTNIAVADTARVTRETEASATETRQTAAELAVLGRDLMRLVTAKAGS